MELGKPSTGKGKRAPDCSLYSDCLGIAAKEDWPTFNCESCPNYITDPVEKKAVNENKRLCEDCGKNPTISPKHRYCPSCMGRRAHVVRKVKKNGPGKQNKKDATYNIPGAERASPRGDLELIISFGKYGTILKEVESLAEKEMRPIDLQVIYMLKNALRGGPN
jgi:hypothetical protein